MQLIAITVFLFAGFAVSNAQVCADQTEATCCDVPSCALALCKDAVAITCFNSSKLDVAEDLCYNATDTCATPPSTTPEDPTTQNPDSTPSGTTQESTATTEASNTTLSVSTSTSGPTGATDAPSTAAGPTSGPTSEAPTSATPAVCNDGQTFDAASFIGGIVLAIGVMGIVFLGCKFFRAKSEQTYHQF